MKKSIVLLVSFVLIFTAVGCNKMEQDELKMFSFCGENNYISVSNGVIVLDNSTEICYGGDLEVANDVFTDITGYTTTIYLENSERILMSNSVVDETGGTIDVSVSIGKITGDVLNDTDIEKIDENLWFELKTIDLNGEENTYQLQLKLIEITNWNL